MTLHEASHAVGQRVTYRSISGMELHGEIRYVGPGFVWVRYDHDRHFTPKATHPDLLELEA